MVATTLRDTTVIAHAYANDDIDILKLVVVFDVNDMKCRGRLICCDKLVNVTLELPQQFWTIRVFLVGEYPE